MIPAQNTPLWRENIPSEDQARRQPRLVTAGPKNVAGIWIKDCGLGDRAQPAPREHHCLVNRAARTQPAHHPRQQHNQNQGHHGHHVEPDQKDRAAPAIAQPTFDHRYDHALLQRLIFIRYHHIRLPTFVSTARCLRRGFMLMAFACNFYLPLHPTNANVINAHVKGERDPFARFGFSRRA